MSRTRGERGQATVELALLLPLVATLALAVAQVAVVAHRQVLVVHAAREAARAAAVEGPVRRQEAAVAAAARAGALAPDRLDVEARTVADRVVVEVRFDEPTDVPLVGSLLPDVGLVASASMWIEHRPDP